MAVEVAGTLESRNWRGSSTVSRSDQMCSPNTLFEAQFRVEPDFRNSSGLTIMNTSTRATAATDHQPIQSRLQTARISRGRTANRVQTDHGLAWRIQLSPLSPNRLATLRSEVPLARRLPLGVDGAAGVLIWDLLLTASCWPQHASRGWPLVSVLLPVGQGEADQLGPRPHPELHEHVAQVVVDGAPTQEELGADLAVGAALPHQLDDLELLGGELAEGRRVALAGGLAGGPQLGPGPLRPGGGLQPLEALQGAAQVGPGLTAAPGPAQRLPVGQLGPGQVERAGLALLQGQGLLEAAGRLLVGADQPPAAGQLGQQVGGADRGGQ